MFMGAGLLSALNAMSSGYHGPVSSSPALRSGCASAGTGTSSLSRQRHGLSWPRKLSIRPCVIWRQVQNFPLMGSSNFRSHCGHAYFSRTGAGDSSIWRRAVSAEAISGRSLRVRLAMASSTLTCFPFAVFEPNRFGKLWRMSSRIMNLLLYWLQKISLLKKPVFIKLMSSPHRRFALSGCIRCRAALKKLHGRLNATGVMRYARCVQTHFHACQRANQHEIVEIAKMADAENSAFHPAQACAQGDIVLLKRNSAEAVRIVSLRCEDRSERIRIFTRIERHHFQSPVANGSAHSFRVAVMPGKDIFHALFQQHGDGFPQSKKKIGGRSVGKKAARVIGEHLLPVPIGARHAIRLRCSHCLLRYSVEAQPRWQHQAFLRSGDGYVNSP